MAFDRPDDKASHAFHEKIDIEGVPGGNFRRLLDGIWT